MKIKLLIIIGITIASVGIVGLELFSEIAYAEKKWYPGIGLKINDTFHYDACGMWDNTICHPFEMTLHITDSIDDVWGVLMIIDNLDDKNLEIPMNISKNNAVVVDYDDQLPSRSYVNFYWDTLACLGVYSSFENPSRLDKSPFGDQVWIGTTPAITNPPEELSETWA